MKSLENIAGQARKKGVLFVKVFILDFFNYKDIYDFTSKRLFWVVLFATACLINVKDESPCY